MLFNQFAQVHTQRFLSLENWLFKTACNGGIDSSASGLNEPVVKFREPVPYAILQNLNTNK